MGLCSLAISFSAFSPSFQVVNKVKEQGENLGLYMNVSKTKTMMVKKAGEEKNIAIDVNGQELEQVRDFRYTLIKL